MPSPLILWCLEAHSVNITPMDENMHKMVNFAELNISKFWFLNVSYISYKLKGLKKSIKKQDYNLSNLPLSSLRNNEV